MEEGGREEERGKKGRGEDTSEERMNRWTELRKEKGRKKKEEERRA